MTAKRSDIVLDETPVQASLVPVNFNPGQIQAMISQNLGGETITPGDLERAINPSGKSTKWRFQGLDGEEESVGELTGVIVHSKTKRAYYEKEFSGGNEPPDCYSDDGMTGHGAMADKVGGVCDDCPMSKFGSGKNGSQACSQIKRIYLLRPGDMLPTIVNATPINNRTLKKYGINLMNKRGKTFNQVVSRLNLSTSKSSSGFDYAKLTISLVSELNPVEAEKMEEYCAMIRPILDSASIRTEARHEAIGDFEEPREVVSSDSRPSPSPTGDVLDIEF